MDETAKFRLRIPRVMADQLQDLATHRGQSIDSLVQTAMIAVLAQQEKSGSTVQNEPDQ